MTENPTIGAAMVVGGGIAGIQAALDLADSGYFIYLVEKSGAIGGAMSQFDKIFPTNDCSMCVLAPKLVECGRHPNINILTLAEVTGATGQAGDFTIQVRKSPRYVDMDKCISCGQCADQCPVDVADHNNTEQAHRKAIYIKYPQAVPLKYQIDPQACLQLTQNDICGACADICPADAVNFSDQEEDHEISVGAVIMAPGFQPFDPAKAGIWGYGTFPNVITSLQLEHFFSHSGSANKKLTRPSDGKQVDKMAFLQCIGSRDKNQCNNEYCSSVCCMYALKEAVIAKEASPDLEATIFYTDMRTQGKEFDRYYNSARNKAGINFIRSRIHEVGQDGNSGDLRLHYVNENGKQVEDIFDLVVLSIGMETPESSLKLAETLGIHITPDRFASISSLMPLQASKDGIFTCGTFNGPRDIPQSIIGGSAAAASASLLLSSARHSLNAPHPTSAPRKHDDKNPRIGVFVCHCGSNIAGTVDVKDVSHFASTLPHVVHVENNLFTCSQDTQDLILQQIQDRRLNRIVVAACTPRTHEPLFRETLKTAGISEYLFEMANIRNQNSWVHSNEPDKATQKAKELVSMAVVKVASLEPLKPLRVPITQAALIIGGGIAGMTAALNLADQGFEVHLVEKSDLLGGNGLHLLQTWSGESIPRYIKNTQEEVFSHKNIKVYLNSTVSDSSGHVGNYTTSLKTSSKRKKTIQHGVVIVTIGAKRYIPVEFEYGKLPNVVASIEFDKLHMLNEIRITQGKSFVFIQCVGSRNETRPYCSKYCCTHSIQSAIKLKKEMPERRIFILYREVRTYGQRERLYNQARELGIIFINYELYGSPKIKEEENRLQVEVWDHVLHRPLEIEADIVILASATLANPDASHIGQLYNLPINSDGFFLEAHPKMRPVEFNVDGVFVAGLAHYPKPIEESISQALAAAAKATGLLSQKEMTLDPLTAIVDPLHCDGCALCIDVCPYDAIRLLENINDDGQESKIVAIDEFLCKGCGICQGTCPKRGVTITGFTYQQIQDQIDAALASSSND